MKNKLKFYLLLLSFGNCFCQNNTNITGKWENKNKNYINQIEFKNDNTAILYNENNIASSPFQAKIDYKKNPIWVDLKINKNGVISQVFGLAELIDERTMKFELYLNSEIAHPINFISGEHDDSIVSFILNKS